MDVLSKLFDTSDFPARWHCGEWTPALGWLHILSDLGVWSAYIVIPGVLGYFAIRRRDVPFRTLFWLFGAFILACGTTHLMEAVIFWWPAYRLAGLIKLFTACVSWATVLALIPATPKALAMRGPHELGREISARKEAENALAQANADLERRVQSRTAELARANEALRESEQRWRDLAEALPNLVWTDRPDGTCDYLSSQWREYTGIPESELLEFAWLDRVVHPDDRERTRACWMTAVADKGGYDVEYRIRRHDGGYRWFKTRGVPIRDGQGRIVKWFGTCTDIEDQKQAVEELRQGEERFRQLADSMPQMVYTVRPDRSTEYLNRRWYEYTGLPERDLENWSSVVHPDDLEPCLAEAKRTFGAGQPFEMEIRLREARTGLYRWHLARSVPVRDQTGQLVRWYGTSTDIHDRKQAEDAARFLAEASATLATVVDYETTLLKVAALAVPQFADWSAVDVAEPDGTLRRLAFVHQDPEKLRLARALIDRYPPEQDAPGSPSRVFRTGQPAVIAELTDEMLAKAARDEEHLGMLRALGLRSYICVPLVAAGKTLGVLTFATAESGRRYADADLAMAEDLAHRAAIAIQNAELYRELRAADRLKDEFLAMLAHELRNPLAAIRNAHYVMKSPGADETILPQVREIAERQVDHMARLLDDLLDVARISRGRIELRKEALDAGALADHTVEAIRPLVEARKHELTVSVPDEPAWVEADPTRLEQILNNLLNNAAKYTDPGGRIHLAVECEGGEVALRVGDTGVGIAPEMLPRIFDPFVQAERRLDRSHGGVGIGLTLVKKLVDLHGGSVVARSAGTGCGSEFIVRLPAVPAPAERSEKTVDEDTTRPLSRRVLVVDDNRDAADSLALHLRLAGQDARAAYDGPSALALTKEFDPDVIFLDIGMPGMDGYEVARRLRQDPESKGVVLVALTGWGQNADRQRSLEAGFDHHLVKPVDAKTLTDLLAGTVRPAD
ncbi:MAG TPA: PAS domain-containing protein [Pirellulales bacterium]|jgi:PAS domain S-box-containing protein|nr:PAS domain-containing protein [Pirellulales bacterium]